MSLISSPLKDDSFDPLEFNFIYKSEYTASLFPIFKYGFVLIIKVE